MYKLMCINAYSFVRKQLCIYIYIYILIHIYLYIYREREMYTHVQ